MFDRPPAAASATDASPDEDAKVVRMDWLWFLGAVAIIAWLVAIVDMIRRRGELKRGQLAAWVLIVIILPVVGTILYFVLARKPQARSS